MLSAVRWLDDREQRTWRSFLQMQDRLSAQLNREMQERSGVSAADFAVLVQLSEQRDDRLRVLELARALRWEKSRLSHQLTRMQQRGLIDRSGCSEDRRGAFVVLTALGRSTVEAAAPLHVESVRHHLFDRLSAEQVDLLAGVTAAVLAGLDADAADAPVGSPCGTAAESDAPCDGDVPASDCTG